MSTLAFKTTWNFFYIAIILSSATAERGPTKITLHFSYTSNSFADPYGQEYISGLLPICTCCLWWVNLLRATFFYTDSSLCPCSLKGSVSRRLLPLSTCHLPWTFWELLHYFHSDSPRIFSSFPFFLGLFSIHFLSFLFVSCCCCRFSIFGVWFVCLFLFVCFPLLLLKIYLKAGSFLPFAVMPAFLMERFFFIDFFWDWLVPALNKKEKKKVIYIYVYIKGWNSAKVCTPCRLTFLLVAVKYRR